MSVIEAGRAYRLKNKQSGYYLTPHDNSVDPGGFFIQYRLQDRSRWPYQTWHVMPIDQGGHLVVSASSALHPTPVAYSTSQCGIEAQPLQPGERGTAQTWMLREVERGTYTVSNKRSGLYLGTADAGDAESARIEQGPQRPGDATQQWVLETAAEYRQILGLDPVAEVDEIGDVHRITGFGKPRLRTAETLVGRTVLPFPVVADSTPTWQTVNSPYYVLRRYGYWQLVYYYEHGGVSDYSKGQEITLGLTTCNSRQIEQTTGMSVTASAGFSFAGLSLSVSATVSEQLKVSASTSATESSSRTESVTRRYPANGRRAAEALWYRGDHYVLERMDGTVVLDWRTLNPETAVNDGFPDNEVAAQRTEPEQTLTSMV